MSNTSGNTANENSAVTVNDEILGDIHPPVLRRQLTNEKYVYVAKGLAEGSLTPDAAVQQLNSYMNAPADDATSAENKQPLSFQFPK